LSDDVNSLVGDLIHDIADADIDRAKTLGAMLKDLRILSQRFDARNVENIVDVIKECDIVIDGLPGCYSPNAIEATMRASVKFAVSVNPPRLNGKLIVRPGKRVTTNIGRRALGLPCRVDNPSLNHWL
jgi:hypothetical protein